MKNNISSLQRLILSYFAYVFHVKLYHWLNLRWLTPILTIHSPWWKHFTVAVCTGHMFWPVCLTLPIIIIIIIFFYLLFNFNHCLWYQIFCNQRLWFHFILHLNRFYHPRPFYRKNISLYPVSFSWFSTDPFHDIFQTFFQLRFSHFFLIICQATLSQV